VDGALIFFRKLRRGDRLWIVAPSGPMKDRRNFYGGVEILMERFGVEVRKSVFSSKGFFAGSDLLRARELERAVAARDCRGIYSMRGGYGVTRILGSVDWSAWMRDPKPVLGFSDISALHLALLSRGLAVGVHSPSVSTLPRQPERYLRHLFRLLVDESYDFSPPPARLGSLFRGSGCGPLVGGNLSMLEQLVGTGFMPDLSGAVLLLEDVGEPPYRIDRMLVHLRSAGVLDGLSGIVLGDFTRCADRRRKVGLKEVFLDNFSLLRIPVASRFPAGHGRRNWAFIQGARVILACGPSGTEAHMAPDA
jgi:muramoyltetrapeptide carboxypeptidase